MSPRGTIAINSAGEPWLPGVSAEDRWRPDKSTIPAAAETPGDEDPQSPPT